MFLDSEITKTNPHVAKRRVFKEKERVPIKRLSARSKPWMRQCASTAWSCITMGAAVFSLPVMPIGCCSENENLSLLSFVPLPTDYILQLLFSVLSPVPNPPRFYLDMQPRKLPISDWDKVQILPTTPIPMSDNDSNLGQIFIFLMIFLLSGSGLR